MKLIFHHASGESAEVEMTDDEYAVWHTISKAHNPDTLDLLDRPVVINPELWEKMLEQRRIQIAETQEFFGNIQKFAYPEGAS